MNLYQKGILAFAVVILFAVVTVALLVGPRIANEFRYYNMLYSNRAEMLVQDLADYYAAHGTWAGVQETLPTSPGPPGRRGDRGNGNVGGPPAALDFRGIPLAVFVVASLLQRATCARIWWI